MTLVYVTEVKMTSEYVTVVYLSTAYVTAVFKTTVNADINSLNLTSVHVIAVTRLQYM